MHTELKTGPITTALTLQTLKNQIKPASSDDDTYLTHLLESVTAYAEACTQTRYITQTHTVYMDSFPSNGIIELPLSPLQSVVSIKYYDTAGTQQTWDSANYRVSSASRIPRLQAVDSFPSTQDRIDAVEIEIIVGYGDADTDIPKDIQNAIILMCRYLYDNPADPVKAKQTAADLFLMKNRVYRKPQ